MIGTTVETKRPWPFSAILFLLIAGVMLVWALVERKDRVAAWTGVGLFGMAATVRWLGRDRRQRLTFNEDTLEFHPPGRIVPYAELQGLRSDALNVRPLDQPYRIEILLEHGSLEIPASSSPPSWDIEQFLTSRLVRNRLPVDPAARDHLEQMVSQFGLERVWWTNGTPAPKQTYINKPLLLSGGLLAASGFVVLLFLAHGKNEDAVMTVGGFSFIFGVLSALCSFLPIGRAGPKLKNRDQAVVIVTPLGVAVQQGDLQGEARWDEIHDIKLRKSRSFVVSAEGIGAGLILKMAGVSIPLINIYDRPLRELHERMIALWR